MYDLGFGLCALIRAVPAVASGASGVDVGASAGWTAGF